MFHKKDSYPLLYDVDHETEMNYNSKITISFVIALTSLLAATSPALPVLPSFAQSDGDDDSTGSSDYKDFVNCLAQSEGDKGFANEGEIRDCFRPIYDPETSSNSVASDSASDDRTGSTGSTGSDDANSNNDDNTENTSNDDDNSVASKASTN